MQKRVLIAEDNNDVREMMTLMIEMYGYQPLEAENGAAAVEKTRQYHPDLILMDIMMPEMDGIEATEIIRRSEEFARLPIVAVTAYDSSYHQKAIDAGCNAVLPKPVDFDKLKPVLFKYLES